MQRTEAFTSGYNSLAQAVQAAISAANTRATILRSAGFGCVTVHPATFSMLPTGVDPLRGEPAMFNALVSVTYEEPTRPEIETFSLERVPRMGQVISAYTEWKNGTLARLHDIGATDIIIGEPQLSSSPDAVWSGYAFIRYTVAVPDSTVAVPEPVEPLTWDPSKFGPARS